MDCDRNPTNIHRQKRYWDSVLSDILRVMCCESFEKLNEDLVQRDGHSYWFSFDHDMRTEILGEMSEADNEELLSEELKWLEKLVGIQNVG
jgi:hypothetical protein